MRIIFRVDASVQIGSGHLMRCLTLAEAVRERGAQTYFICRERAGSLIPLLGQREMPVRVLTPSQIPPVEDAKQTVEALNGNEPDWLVVDHYDLGIDWENQLRPHVGRLLVIDDLARRHHECDVLLDQNYSEEDERRYAEFVAPTCKVLAGPRYALLRKEFRVMREQLGPRAHRLNRIMVFFTAGNDQGETLKAMRGIELFGKAEMVDVVVGQANPDNVEIRARCAELRWEFHCQVDYMPKLIARADVVIGAGGSSNWERCALGVPALVAILADNQAPVVHALARAGVIRSLGWSQNLQPADYRNALLALNRDCLAAMTEKSLALVDARGTERMAEVLLAV